MAQDQNIDKDQVLIARNNETGETGAVKGLKQDGTPDMTVSRRFSTAPDTGIPRHAGRRM